MSQLLKQLKYIISGGAIVWWLDVQGELATVLNSSGWPGITAQASLAIGCITVGIFLYLMIVLPRVKGINPDYAHWRSSSDLSVLVPALTTAIVSGWSLLLFSLSSWSSLNIWQSIIASIGSYALVFGVIGLIPVPYRRTL